MLIRKIVIYLVKSAENFIFEDFFAVKVNGSDVNPGICAEVFILTYSWFDVIFVNFNSKKSMKMNFSADKICCNFSHEYPKISNM